MPYQILVAETGVRRIVVRTLEGFFGLLPRRLDCTLAVEPGILTYETETGHEVYLAVDQGVLVKAGENVMVSVRNAIQGAQLDELHQEVTREFLNLDAREKSARVVLAEMESGLVRRLMEYQRA